MRIRLLAAVLAAAALVVPAAPGPLTAPAAAAAAGPLSGRGIPVFPGLARHVLDLRLDDGRPAVANVLSFRLDPPPSGPRLSLRPVLAQERVPGLETVPDMGQRLLPQGGVAGVNGGFWLPAPVGDPNGYLAVDGLLVSEPQTQGAGPRGTVAVRQDGRVVMDRLDGVLELHPGDLPRRRMTAINRYHSDSPPYPDGDDPIYLYTRHFGERVDVRPLSSGEEPRPVHALVVDDLQPPAGVGAATGRVSSIVTVPGQVPIPVNGSVLVAHGANAVELAALVAGDPVQVRVLLQPMSTSTADWTGIDAGLAAGPLLIAEGRPTEASGWENEGFAPPVHSTVRHPRTAVAQTSDGRLLLVTVDGRQQGYSHGMTIAELTRFLLDLSAVQAVSLDGGGSTQMVVDGLLRNRACCDRPLRPVADGLFVFHDYVFAATGRVAGPTREATAAAAAQTTFPDGVQEVLLASAATFPDALTGGPLAVARGAALLLSGRDAPSPATAAALQELRPRRVTLLGGPAVLSEELRDALRRDGYEVTRVSGRERTETAARVAEQLGPRHERVFLAAAGGFADALSAAAPAGLLRRPILLTARDELSAATRDALTTADVREVVIVGGPSAVAIRVEEQVAALGIAITRLAGPTRYGTATRVNDWAAEQVDDADATGLVVALGSTFPDALAGGPYAAARRQLLLIVPPVDVEADPDTAAFLRRRADGQLARITLLGGHAVLSSYQQWQLDRLTAP